MASHLDLNSVGENYLNDIIGSKERRSETQSDVITLPRGFAPVDTIPVPKVLVVSEREENRQWICDKLEKEKVPFIEVRSIKKALNYILREPIKMLIVNCSKDIQNICDLFEKADAAFPPRSKVVIPFKACSSCKKCEMKCAKSIHFKHVG